MTRDTNAIARVREAAERDAGVRFPMVSRPVDCTDAVAFPEIARAIAGLAAMSPERRAELDKDYIA